MAESVHLGSNIQLDANARIILYLFHRCLHFYGFITRFNNIILSKVADMICRPIFFGSAYRGVRVHVCRRLHLAQKRKHSKTGLLLLKKFHFCSFFLQPSSEHLESSELQVVKSTKEIRFFS